MMCLRHLYATLVPSCSENYPSKYTLALVLSGRSTTVCWSTLPYSTMLYCGGVRVMPDESPAWMTMSIFCVMVSIYAVLYFAREWQKKMTALLLHYEHDTTKRENDAVTRRANANTFSTFHYYLCYISSWYCVLISTFYIPMWDWHGISFGKSDRYDTMDLTDFFYALAFPPELDVHDVQYVWLFRCFLMGDFGTSQGSDGMCVVVVLSVWMYVSIMELEWRFPSTVMYCFTPNYSCISPTGSKILLDGFWSWINDSDSFRSDP